MFPSHTPRLSRGICRSYRLNGNILLTSIMVHSTSWSIQHVLLPKRQMTQLSEIVIAHRRLSGLSQAGLAKLAGVGKTVVFDLEHGKLSIRYDTLAKILAVLNITIAFDSPIMERLRAASAGDALPPTEPGA